MVSKFVEQDFSRSLPGVPDHETEKLVRLTHDLNTVVIVGEILVVRVSDFWCQYCV